MSLADVFSHHNSSCFIYHRVHPITDVYHEGALMVVTDRNPNDAWLDYVDQLRAQRPLEQVHGLLDYPPTLGVADLVFVLHGRWPEQVHVFPRDCYY